MEITYLYHSGFCVELSHNVLLFDYYQGELPHWPEDKHIWVLVSHRHRDHFQHRIFQLADHYPHITFLLSKDTKMTPSYMDRIGVPLSAREHIQYLSKNTSCLEGEELFIETLASTDEGVAFVVNCEGKSIYHAGDLNWWTWPGEETKQEYEDMTKRFHKEMEKLRGRYFDAAFLPLDARQGERYFWGFHAFMTVTHTAAAFPMHCFGDYSVMERIDREGWCDGYRNRIHKMTESGQKVVL